MSPGATHPEDKMPSAETEHRWVHWFVKFHFSDFWSANGKMTDIRVRSAVIRFRVPVSATEEQERDKAEEIATLQNGPSTEHKQCCKHCQTTDEDDNWQWYGVRKFLVVEKLPAALPVIDSEAQARKRIAKTDATCPEMVTMREESRTARVEAKRLARMEEIEEECKRVKEKKLEKLERELTWERERV